MTLKFEITLMRAVSSRSGKVGDFAAGCSATNAACRNRSGPRPAGTSRFCPRRCKPCAAANLSNLRFSSAFGPASMDLPAAGRTVKRICFSPSFVDRSGHHGAGLSMAAQLWYATRTCWPKHPSRLQQCRFVHASPLRHFALFQNAQIQLPSGSFLTTLCDPCAVPFLGVPFS